MRSGWETETVIWSFDGRMEITKYFLWYLSRSYKFKRKRDDEEEQDDILHFVGLIGSGMCCFSRENKR